MARLVALSDLFAYACSVGRLTSARFFIIVFVIKTIIGLRLAISAQCAAALVAVRIIIPPLVILIIIA